MSQNGALSSCARDNTPGQCMHVDAHKHETCRQVDHAAACLHNRVAGLVAHAKVRQDWRDVKHDGTQVSDGRCHRDSQTLSPVSLNSSQLALTAQSRPQLFHVRPDGVVIAHCSMQQLLHIWDQHRRGRRSRSRNAPRSAIDDRRTAIWHAAPPWHGGDAVERVSLSMIPSSGGKLPVACVT